MSFLPDIARALVSLGDRPEAWGRPWHIPTAPAVPMRDFFELAYREAGTSGRASVMGPTMLRLGGVFVPEAREIIEILDQFDRPFVVDGSAFEAAFGLFSPTPHDQPCTRRWSGGERAGPARPRGIGLGRRRSDRQPRGVRADGNLERNRPSVWSPPGSTHERIAAVIAQLGRAQKGGHVRRIEHIKIDGDRLLAEVKTSAPAQGRGARPERGTGDGCREYQDTRRCLIPDT